MFSITRVPIPVNADGSVDAFRVTLNGVECLHLPARPAPFEESESDDDELVNDELHLQVHDDNSSFESHSEEEEDDSEDELNDSEDEFEDQHHSALYRNWLERHQSPPLHHRKRARLVESTFSDTCNICLETYKENDKIATLMPCAHVFHTTCIRAWETQQKHNILPCPCCRTQNDEQ
jgi:hypothetical protein